MKPHHGLLIIALAGAAFVRVADWPGDYSPEPDTGIPPPRFSATIVPDRLVWGAKEKVTGIVAVRNVGERAARVPSLHPDIFFRVNGGIRVECGFIGIDELTLARPHNWTLWGGPEMWLQPGDAIEYPFTLVIPLPFGDSSKLTIVSIEGSMAVVEVEVAPEG